MNFLLFFALWVSLLTLAYFYVGRRFIRPMGWNGRRKVIAWSTLVLFFLAPQAPFFLLVGRREGSVVDALSWAGYIILGLFSLVFTGLIMRDLLLGIGRMLAWLKRNHLGKNRQSKSMRATASHNPERRRFLLRSTNAGIIGASFIASGYGLYESRRRAVVEEITVPIRNLPAAFDGFRIAQFSDLHVGPTIKRAHVEGITAQLQALHSDLIAFTGDLVDGSVAWLREDVAPLRELSAPHGKYFVTGNHEYYSGAPAWIAEAERLGFDVLMNEHRLIARHGLNIVLAGVTDYSAGQFYRHHASDPMAAIRYAPSGLPKILLAHQPRSIEAAAAAGYNLQLSGHTHGGQFFPWNIVATLNQPYIKGLHLHGETRVYVNRGAGYWGPPLRLGNPPEITIIVLTKA